MRYTYGILDEKKILMYKPQLFLKDRDLLFFPSSDFHKWHNDIKEYLDALYQIDSLEIANGNSINLNELNLAMGVVNDIKLELEQIFDSNKISNFSYHYLSILDKRYKRLRSSYTSDMRRCDMIIPVITRQVKYDHLREILFEAENNFQKSRKRVEDRQNEKKRLKKEFRYEN